MNKEQIIKILESKETFDEILNIINKESEIRGCNINDYPSHYFMAGGSVANTIHYLLNKERIEKPVINDIDLFNFSHNINDFLFYQIEPSNFIHNFIGDTEIQIDGYDRFWVGDNGDHMRMVSSERFGDINKVTINVYSNSMNQFKETNFYLDLLKVFDLSCCMAGLDRINNKIIYTDNFIDFLINNRIEVTNLSQPLQTTVRLHKKIGELKTDDSNLQVEMSLIQHSFLIIKSNHIGPEWLEKTKKYSNLVLKYFDFKKEQNNQDRNIFYYGVKEYEINNYFYFFNKNKNFLLDELIIFWDIFIRNKNVKTFNTLHKFYTNKFGDNIFSNYKKKYSENIFLIKNKLVTDFISILYLIPGYFDCEYTEDDVNDIDKHLIYVNKEMLVDPFLFLTYNIKDHIKMFNFIHNHFVDGNLNFKSLLFKKVITRIMDKRFIKIDNDNNIFDYDKKVKRFKSSLNSLWIKHYPYQMKHKFKKVLEL